MKETMKNVLNNAEMVLISRAEYDALRIQNELLTEQLRLLNKKIFGASSEKTSQQSQACMEGQMTFPFNEAEVCADAPKAEPEKTTVAAHTRKKHVGGLEGNLPDDLPVEIVDHRLAKEQLSCPECGTEMVEIGKEIRRSLVIIPAKKMIREDHFYTYACKRCERENIKTPIRKTTKTAPVIPGSYASPEAIAHIMVQKYVMGSPLYRQEQELNRSGVMLSRQTMSNWILRAAEDWLKPIYEQLHRDLLQHQVLHADETTLQVLREPGKAAQTKSYMWLYRTGSDAEHPIVLYEYKDSRRAENTKAFLKGFSGYLHADGYAGYHKLQPEIAVVGCWAHARRKFDEALNAVPVKERSTSMALKGLEFCNHLFSIEKRLEDLPPEDRYEQRLSQAKPVLDALWRWTRTIAAVPKSSLGKALHYLEEQWPYLCRYLEDGRLEISNNRAERSIKPFVTDRKNFLFSNTPGGAQGSAVIFSLIETAKENDLDPFRYLTHVLTEAPALASAGQEWVSKLMPANAPTACRVPAQRKH